MTDIKWRHRSEIAWELCLCLSLVGLHINFLQQLSIAVPKVMSTSMSSILHFPLTKQKLNVPTINLIFKEYI